MAVGIDPKVDYDFKRLFGLDRNRDLLISLINAVLDRPPAEEVVDVEILNPFNPKELEEDKLSIVDVKARDGLGRLFDIKMQLAPSGQLDKRLLFYWAKLYSAQLAAGDDYHIARQTILIAFCDFRLYPGDRELHHRFELRDSKTGVKFTNDIELHTIELPKLTLEQPQAGDRLIAWSYFLRYAEDYDPKAPPALFQGQVWEHAWKELTMISLRNEERDLYEARLKLTRDERAKLDHARNEGRNEGRTEGLDYGILIGRINLLESMLALPLTTREDLEQRSMEQLRDLEQSLLSRVPDRSN